MDTLSGKYFLITGANRGIGRAICLKLCELGAHVLGVARNQELFYPLSMECEPLPGSFSSVQCDVTRRNSVQELLRYTTDHFPQVNGLINNAGIGIFKEMDHFTEEEFDRVMDTNLKGMFLVTQAFLPLLKKNQSGDIINIASFAGKNSFTGGTVYSASKWGVIGFSRSLMLEVRNDNIRVVTICPGSVNTNFGEKQRDNAMIIQPEDVAETVVFALTMPRNSNVSEIDIRPTKIVH